MNFYSIKQIRPARIARIPGIAALAALLLCAGAWSAAAGAAQVKPPPRPVASKQVVVQAGEPYEARARRLRKHSNNIKNKRDHLKDDSAPGTSATPEAALQVPAADPAPTLVVGPS